MRVEHEFIPLGFEAGGAASLVLEATVGPNDAACVVSWSLAEGATAGGSALQELALADTSKSIAAAASARIPLVLAPAALTARSSYVFALEAERRWAVTGTPVQNAVGELFSLLHFLRLPGVADSAQSWLAAMARPGRLALLPLARVLLDLLLQLAVRHERVVVHPLAGHRADVFLREPVFNRPLLVCVSVAGDHRLAHGFQTQRACELVACLWSDQLCRCACRLERGHDASHFGAPPLRVLEQPLSQAMQLTHRLQMGIPAARVTTEGGVRIEALHQLVGRIDRLLVEELEQVGIRVAARMA